MAGLYIHIPFCHSKCSYCDFYSGLNPEKSAGYADAVIAELRLRRTEIKEPFTTIYIGGGTPSSLPVDDLHRIINSVKAYVDTSVVDEFTVEVNPEDVTNSLLADYRDMGINRISMGVQSFDDTLLQSINRRHSARQALDAISLLRSGDWNYSIDLMFGIPGQSMERWRMDVDRLMAIRPPHFSAYLLSYEPGTRLYAMLQTGKVEEATENLATAMQQYITETAQQNGYRHYEISNYALPGKHSCHNSAYWTMAPYLGIGASAHSYDGTVRRINPANIRKYISSLTRGTIAAETEEESADEIFNDYIITGLRTATGLNLDTLRGKFPQHYITGLLEAAAPIIKSGRLILAGNDQLSIPEAHWLKSDAIMRDLLRV